MEFAERFVGSCRNFFDRNRSLVESGLERFGPHHEKLRPLAHQSARILITRAQGRNGRFETAILQHEVAHVCNRAAIQPRAQVGR